MRLIDADALKEDLRHSYECLKKIYDGLTYPEDKQICAGQLTTFTEAILRVKEAPTIEAEPAKQGHWIYHIDDLFPAESKQECSYCGKKEFITIQNENYCPNCGAKMNDEGEKQNADRT